MNSGLTHAQWTSIGVVTSGDMMSYACCFATPRTSSSAFPWSTFDTSTKRAVLVSPRTRPNLPTVRCAASVTSALSVADAPVASIDVEFAHFLGSGRITTAAAEVCLLKDTGAVLLHSYICPDISRVEGIKWIGGVTPEAWKAASSAAHVQADLLTLLHGHLLIGFGLSKDLAALGITYPSTLQKDLMRCSKFQNSSGQARRLQDITDQYLGQAIQAGKHSAREDAYAAMQLYQLYVKDDPASMTYQELVKHELCKINSTAESKPEGM